MSPHRLTTYRRYRVSNDVLILILSNLDPPSLWRACKAFRRIYVMVMEFQPLLYIFELAIAGMRDGLPSHSMKSPIGRLPLLLSYRKDWPKLHWTHEYKMPIPPHSSAGVSGGFIHQIRGHGGTQCTLDLAELPSCRTGRPPSMTRHLRFATDQIENVVIDRSQSLVVTSHVFSGQNGQLFVRLLIRDLWTFGKHPQSSLVVYDFTTGGSIPIAKMPLVVCGNKIAISIEFVGGKVQHLLMNWRNQKARWLEDQDIHFLNQNHLLVVKRSRGLPVLNIYNITEIDSLTVEREYELPEVWRNSKINFCLNTAPLTDSPPSSEALFYPDPSIRVLLIKALTPPESIGSAPLRHWLFINESYFRPTSRKDRLRVSWVQWSESCLIRDIAPSTQIRGPHVISNRVLYVESELDRSTAQLKIIDFAPYPDSSCRHNRAWSLIGQRSLLVPNETSREIPSKSGEAVEVNTIQATEDNIVMFFKNNDGSKTANILTFGAIRTRG